MDRYKFAFTMRDSPSDYVNVTCWGSEAYIRSLVDSFKICDVGKPVHTCIHVCVNMCNECEFSLKQSGVYTYIIIHEIDD